MDRLEKLREKLFETAIWQKLFYRNQKSCIQKRLEAVKYLYEGIEVMVEVLTAVFEQARHKRGRRAKPRNGFYIFICGGFESKLL